MANHEPNGNDNKRPVFFSVNRCRMKSIHHGGTLFVRVSEALWSHAAACCLFVRKRCSAWEGQTHDPTSLLDPIGIGNTRTVLYVLVRDHEASRTFINKNVCCNL